MKKNMPLIIIITAVISVLAAFRPLQAAAESVFDEMAAQAAVNEGVREISYEQFRNIRGSGEDFLLLDVLAEDSFAGGHIDGAENFPVNAIDDETAARRIPQGSNVIVYCGSFMCGASTSAAKKLSSLGYNVVDYKGGLAEWREKGNPLVK